MTKRRLGTRPHHTFWTPEGIAMIEAYQAQQRIPSFSAMAETLVRMGLERSPGEIIAPVIVSTIRHELTTTLDRLIKLLVYDIIETGITQRLAGAALRDIGWLKRDDPDRYDRIKAAAIVDARRMVGRTQIDQILRDLYGDRESELSPARIDDGDSRETRGALLHDAER